MILVFRLTDLFFFFLYSIFLSFANIHIFMGHTICKVYGFLVLGNLENIY